MKEFFRKRMVALKRKPQTIALLVLGLAFVFYSLNLTHVSNTTAYIQGAGMGLSGFVIMLFSVLALVCFINAFPHRKKVNVPMLVLMFLMLAILIVCDTFYMGQIVKAITRADHPIVVDANTAYITKAYDMLNVHRFIVLAGAVLTLLVPVLRKALKKINTSLAVEENAQMSEIMLSGDN